MGKITVIGTGWTRGQLTLDAVAALTGGARVLLHTRRCGCAEWLQEKGIAFESLDDLYEQFDDFDAHADAAAQAVLDAAAAGDVVYGVFDVRDVSAARLAARASVEIIPGPPAEGCCWPWPRARRAAQPPRNGRISTPPPGKTASSGSWTARRWRAR